MAIDDVNSGRDERSGGGFGRAVRTFLLWVFIVTIAVAAGFAAGYVLRYQELRDVERRSTEERAEMAADMARLERRVLETEKAQLEQALARANVVANLDDVLEMLPAALAEIEQFGQAMRDIDTAEDALTEAGVSGTERDALDGSLGALRERLKALDLKARARIAASADDLEAAMALEEHAFEEFTEPPALNDEEEEARVDTGGDPLAAEAAEGPASDPSDVDPDAEEPEPGSPTPEQTPPPPSEPPSGSSPIPPSVS